jgi:biopolymer transport protein ExbD
MKKLLAGLTLLVLASFFAGCTTTGPHYSAVIDTFPPLAAGDGRIFVYRDAIYNPSKMPAVLLNGEQVGLSKAQGFFYVDQPAGEYKIELSGESSRPASFTLSPGQTVYVRINVHTNLSLVILYPEVVDASIAQRELISCKYASGNATTETPAEPAAAANDGSPAKIEIIIGQGGQVSINGDPISDDQLLPLLKKDHDSNPNIVVLIKADKSIPLQKMEDVMNACTAAGLNRFSLQAQ